jgi:hypothetical protein
MKHVRRRIPGFIAIAVGMLSVAAIWSFATTYRQKRLPGPAWEMLTSTERTALFLRLRGHQKKSIFIGCDRAECVDLASSLIEVFKRVGWSAVSGDAEDYEAVGVKIVSCLDEGAELWDAINTKTSLHPVLVSCPSQSPSSGRTMLVIGAKPLHEAAAN